MLSTADITLIVTGIIMGTSARIITLKVDFRQIPTYPSAYFNNIVLGLIASALGAIAIPAILEKNYASVTFLTVAVQQFREIRKAERDSLEKLEHSEYIQRGAAYIDGISKTFESRSYISLVTALLTVLAMKMVNFPTPLINIAAGVLAGLLGIFLCHRFTKGKTIDNICTVRQGKIDVRGSELYVDDMFVTNYLGTERSQESFLKEGIAVVLEPKDDACRITLENYGQRQAIFFEAVRALGVKRYKFMRRNFATGKVILAFVPIHNNPIQLIRAVRNTPILENSRKIERIMDTQLGG